MVGEYMGKGVWGEVWNGGRTVEMQIRRAEMNGHLTTFGTSVELVAETLGHDGV